MWTTRKDQKLKSTLVPEQGPCREKQNVRSGDNLLVSDWGSMRRNIIKEMTVEEILEKQWYCSPSSKGCLLIFLGGSILTSFPSFKSFHHLPLSYFLSFCLSDFYFDFIFFHFLSQECCQWRAPILSVCPVSELSLTWWLAKTRRMLIARQNLLK